VLDRPSACVFLTSGTPACCYIEQVGQLIGVYSTLNSNMTANQYQQSVLPGCECLMQTATLFWCPAIVGHAPYVARVIPIVGRDVSGLEWLSGVDPNAIGFSHYPVRLKAPLLDSRFCPVVGITSAKLSNERLITLVTWHLWRYILLEQVSRISTSYRSSKVRKGSKTSHITPDSGTSTAMTL